MRIHATGLREPSHHLLYRLCGDILDNHTLRPEDNGVGDLIATDGTVVEHVKGANTIADHLAKALGQLNLLGGHGTCQLPSNEENKHIAACVDGWMQLGQ